MNQLHIADIVEVDLVFEYHCQSFSVQLNAQDSSWERELADCGVPLLLISVFKLKTPRQQWLNLCVCDDEPAW